VADYPRVFTLEPVGEWPGELTDRRQVANFRTPGKTANGHYIGPQRVPLAKTMRELATEFEQMKATDPRLLLAVTSVDLTLDGRLRAGRKPWHPGVILVLTTPKGEQRYPSDQYTHWEDNLRAIALTLNALRGVSRWGVGADQQAYNAFLAIESSAIAVPPTPFTREPASIRAWLLDLLEDDDRSVTLSDPTVKLLRRAQRATHPDQGGDAAQFVLVNMAEGYLREAGEV